jgi:transcriptional regulator with XRE-family HTH domain
MESRPLREYLEAQQAVEEMRRTIGSELKSARMSAGISQTFLADAIGVTPGFISNVESGRKTPPSPMLRKAIEVISAAEGGGNASQGAKHDAAKARAAQKEGD